MPDLRERLGELDRLEPPDLWSDALRRRPRPTVPRRRVRRAFAIAVALAVAAGGFVIVAQAFSSTSRSPNPAASDGASILLVRGRAVVGPSRDSEIYRMAQDGSAVTKLTDAVGEGMIATSPAWSPDGSKIAFVLAPPGIADRSSDTGIYVMNADGTDVTRVTYGRYDERPAWSPDGSKIAFTRDQGSWLMVVDVDGSHVRRIRLDGDVFPPYQWPAWSPDGERIAFQASDAAHANTNAVYVADVDGGDAARMTPGDADGYPAWSPDGSTIAFAGPDGIRLLDVASGSQRRLTRCDPRRCGFDFAPGWSPYASRLLFSRQNRAGSSIQVFLVNADGSGLHRLTSGDLWSTEASWRPSALQTTRTPAPLGTSPALDALGRWSETAGNRTMLHDEDDGFTVAYPSDWSVSNTPINDRVCSPYEILALATYPLRPGGDAVMDAQLPSHAVDDLGPDDILIWLNDGGNACGGERRPGTGAGFPDRPAAFGPLTVCEGGDTLCPSDGREIAPGVRGWWMWFRDGNRGFYVFVGMGERVFADPARAQLAWDVLDSLRVDPR